MRVAEETCASLRLWLHLPLSVEACGVDRSDSFTSYWMNPENLAQTGSDAQTLEREEETFPDFRGHSYFHDFVSKALWGGHRRSSSTFDWFVSTKAQRSLIADFAGASDDPAASGNGLLKVKRFIGTVGRTELRLLKDNMTCLDDSSDRDGLRNLLIATFPLSIEACAVRCDIAGQTAIDDIAQEPSRALTLADAQDALEWIRRTFAHWWKPATDADGKGGRYGAPGDTLYRVFLDGKECIAPSGDEVQANFRHAGIVPILPWFDDLLTPLKVDGKRIAHFGDERCYMTSVVSLGDEGLKDRAARQTLLDLSSGDLFRLAEADFSGSGPAYQEPFLEKLRDDYVYDRHGPAPDGKTGNATLFLTTHHHFCAIGAGGFAHRDLPRNTAKYYRHMQFLCLFEYFRLIQFSQRLSELVAGKSDMTTTEFRDALQRIRDDFLSFVHRNRVTSVSTQLQPREIYAKLRKVMGVDAMFHEVEAELSSAADYANAMEARDASRRADALNRLVSLGVPLGLTVALADIEANQRGVVLPDGRSPGIVDFWADTGVIAFFVFLLWDGAAIAKDWQGLNWRERFCGLWRVWSVALGAVVLHLMR
ncbi:hypothetical protein [Salipiger abyssi]|uniref:hypothetical protein n=1 Tax=Salipiger abyssi TaxID=1250539 RepID=UPI001A8CE13E|nr:hypothetical protein [Salipiger abyssi]MBN9890537.1 hypothetical protein [Salipiger abyssi]